MKDQLGQELFVGDPVAFSHNGSYAGLSFARVIKVHKKKITLGGNRCHTCVFPRTVVKISGEMTDLVWPNEE